ncbi:unnamed protein product [Heligmosomoides polygyrus]|uniref:Uncharacterized protein n=1 Tax=Heligmosomoides polygyrus TaxID=6339 RepID=A0A183FG97_HELPZ|nr:unnamed protein product [Heligmosomoides polygyrus]
MLVPPRCHAAAAAASTVAARRHRLADFERHLLAGCRVFVQRPERECAMVETSVDNIDGGVARASRGKSPLLSVDSLIDCLLQSEKLPMLDKFASIVKRLIYETQGCSSQSQSGAIRLEFAIQRNRHAQGVHLASDLFRNPTGLFASYIRQR